MILVSENNRPQSNTLYKPNISRMSHWEYIWKTTNLTRETQIVDNSKLGIRGQGALTGGDSNEISLPWFLVHGTNRGPERPVHMKVSMASPGQALTIPSKGQYFPAGLRHCKSHAFEVQKRLLKPFSIICPVGYRGQLFTFVFNINHQLVCFNIPPLLCATYILSCPRRKHRAPNESSMERKEESGRRSHISPGIRENCLLEWPIGCVCDNTNPSPTLSCSFRSL